MRKVLSVLLVSFISMVTHAQVQLSWAKTYNHGADFKDYATVTAVDPAGNIVVCGANFDDVYENGNIITTIKYDKNGVELWRRHYGGGEINFSLNPVGIAISAAGDIHILTQNAMFEHVYTVLKYASNGTFRWLDRYAGADGYNSGRMADIKVDISGNVYVAGHAAPATIERDLDTDSRYVTAKYNSEGERLWVRFYNGALPGIGLNKAYGLALDGSGNIYVTGASQLNGQVDYATVKYGPTGNELMVLRYNSPGDDYDRATDIALDAFNNIYVTGETTLTGIDKYNTTLKYTSAGTLVWERTSLAKMGSFNAGLKIDAGGNVIIGRSEYAGGLNLGDLNYVVTKYTGNGDFVWNNIYAGPDEQADVFRAMELDHVNNVYVTGVSGNAIATARFNAGNGALHWSQRFIPLAAPFGHDLPFIPVRSVIGIDLDLNFNVYIAGNYDPASADPADFVTLKYSQCNIVCPSNITVNNDPGKCDAVVTFADVTTTGDCGSTLTYSHASGETFPVGETTVTVTSDATGASCSFTITVIDNTPPSITCPGDKNISTNPGVCYATAASVNAGTATATDNCDVSVAGVRSDGLALNANYQVGVTTITWTATDASGNTDVCTQTITIADTEPPVISNKSATTYILSPPNHTMRDVAIDYVISDNCYADTTITVTSNEPVNGVGDGDTDPDWIIIDKKHFQLRAERAAGGTGRIYYIEIKATDPSGNTDIDTIEVRVPHNIKKPNTGQPFKVGSTVSFEGEFWNRPGRTHTAKWLLDGAMAANGVVTESNGNQNGKVTGSYKFNNPGVYKLQMNVTDQTGVMNYANTNGDIDATVVIYDPNGGHAFGGGWYHSPQGALVSDPTATGKVSFGFAVNYRNAAKPKGETQLEFKVGSFEFNALNYEYLSVAGAKAQFRGTGKIIGGQSGVSFIITVIDGALDGTGVDKIRMKIFKNGQVYYDNQPGASDADNPITAVGTNSSIFIQGTQVNSLITSSQIEEQKRAEPEKVLDLFAFPNPSNKQFTLSINSSNTKDRITMQVMDMYGRMIEVKNVTAGSLVRFGEKYIAGTYFVRVIQGAEHKEVKLIKL